VVKCARLIHGDAAVVDPGPVSDSERIGDSCETCVLVFRETFDCTRARARARNSTKEAARS